MDEQQIENLTMDRVMERKSLKKSKTLCIMTWVDCFWGLVGSILGIISLVESGYIHYEDSEMILKTLFNNYYTYISLVISFIILINETIIFINIMRKPKITHYKKFIIFGLTISLIMNIIMLIVHVTLYVLS